MTDILAPFAYMYGKPSAKAKLKAKPEHFIVKENLGFEFTGSGEHLMVQIQKTGENTSFVANELAKACGVKSKDVGWAGLKDRHAITEQWLSIHLPKQEEVDFSSFEKKYPSIKILRTARHNRKLRPGDLIGNDFEITLTEISDMEAVKQRVQLVGEKGVPNYFGAQRFGREGNNLNEARRWGRDNVRTRNQEQRSMYLSTARSWIFNRIISNRLEQHSFNTLLNGDILSTDKGFMDVSDDNIAEMQAKLDNGEAWLTAALAGDNALPTKADALEVEQQVVDAEPELMALIRGNRMRHDRREVLLAPSNLTCYTDENSLSLHFSLSSGSFATSVIRELIEEIPVERQFD